MLRAVRGWERLGIEGDPRRERYAELQEAGMEEMLDFQRQHVAERNKLISIVGDLSIIDLAELESFGAVQQLQVDELFVD